MESGLFGEYFKGPCFHSQGQFKTTWNESAQNIWGKAQSPADWCRAFSLVHVRMRSRSITELQIGGKLLITSYLHVSYIMYREEREVCRLWMMQLNVGVTPPLPASNLGSAAARGGKRLDPRLWP